MSSSNEQTVDTESPLLIKSRPVPRNESSSESTEYDSPEEAANGSAVETDDDTEEAGETEKSSLPVVSKLPLAAKATIGRSNGGKSKTYDRMVYEAVENLSANRRLGVSIQRILKYVNENNEVPNNRAKLFFKKAIDKGLKENIYVHTSGTGCIGSIAFSTEHWNGLKKILKAAEKKEKSKATAKSKPKPKQKVVPKPTEGKLKSTANVKKTQPVKDQNNNSPVGKTATKKPKKATKLSVALPTVKAKPKLKPKANKEKSTAKTTKLEVPNTNGAKPKATTTTRSKS